MSIISGISGMGAAMPQAMSGASMRMPPQQKMSNLFQMIDAAGAGSITKSQFERAFNNMNPPAAFKAIGVDAAFAKLDPAGTGKVSREDFISVMKSLMTYRHQQHAADAQPQTLPNSTAMLNSISIKA